MLELRQPRRADTVQRFGAVTAVSDIDALGRLSDLEDFEVERPRGRNHRDLVADPLADQRAADRRLVRDQAAAWVGFV